MTSTQTPQIFLVNDQGAALGPYTDSEIQPVLRGRQTLGYPGVAVYSVKALNIEHAKGLVTARKLRETTAQRSARRAARAEPQRQGTEADRIADEFRDAADELR